MKISTKETEVLSISTNPRQCLLQVSGNALQQVAVAYGGHCYCVCSVCDVTLRRQIHVSNPTFWRRFLTQCISLYTHSPYSLLCNLLCYYIDFKLSALELKLQVQNTVHSTLRPSNHNCKNI